MAADDRPLAIRGQLPAMVRARQTERMTGGDIKAEIGGTLSTRGKMNPEATRPGMHAPTGPQPFISKARVANPRMALPGKLTDKQMKDHATSSAHSPGVSFTLLEGEGSKGYRAQASFNKVEFENLRGKSYITTTNIDAMQTNPHSSGQETELIGRGHEHIGDASMMQHSIAKRKDGRFALTSRQWMPPIQDQQRPGGWGDAGRTDVFDTFDDAFSQMYRRGVAGKTHFEE